MSDQPKIVFANESKKLVFEDIQPKIVFANEANKLVFDLPETAGSYNYDYNFDYE